MDCPKCRGSVWTAGDWSPEPLHYCPRCENHFDGNKKVIQNPGERHFWHNPGGED